MTLQEHLNDCYAEHHNVMAKAGSMAEFRFEVARNPGLRRQAEKHLASFNEDVLKRDHISRVHQKILTEIVGDAA